MLFGKKSSKLQQSNSLSSLLSTITNNGESDILNRVSGTMPQYFRFLIDSSFNLNEFLDKNYPNGLGFSNNVRNFLKNHPYSLMGQYKILRVLSESMTVSKKEIEGFLGDTVIMLKAMRGLIRKVYPEVTESQSALTSTAYSGTWQQDFATLIQYGKNLESQTRPNEAMLIRFLLLMCVYHFPDAVYSTVQTLDKEGWIWMKDKKKRDILPHTKEAFIEKTIDSLIAHRVPIHQLVVALREVDEFQVSNIENPSYEIQEKKSHALIRDLSDVLERFYVQAKENAQSKAVENVNSATLTNHVFDQPIFSDTHSVEQFSVVKEELKSLKIRLRQPNQLSRPSTLSLVMGNHYAGDPLVFQIVSVLSYADDGDNPYLRAWQDSLNSWSQEKGDMFSLSQAIVEEFLKFVFSPKKLSEDSVSEVTLNEESNAEVETEGETSPTLSPDHFRLFTELSEIMTFYEERCDLAKLGYLNVDGEAKIEEQEKRIKLKIQFYDKMKWLINSGLQMLLGMTKLSMLNQKLCPAIFICLIALKNKLQAIDLNDIYRIETNQVMKAGYINTPAALDSAGSKYGSKLLEIENFLIESINKLCTLINTFDCQDAKISMNTIEAFYRYEDIHASVDYASTQLSAVEFLQAFSRTNVYDNDQNTSKLTDKILNSLNVYLEKDNYIFSIVDIGILRSNNLQAKLGKLSDQKINSLFNSLKIRVMKQEAIAKRENSLAVDDPCSFITSKEGFAKFPITHILNLPLDFKHYQFKKPVFDLSDVHREWHDALNNKTSDSPLRPDVDILINEVYESVFPSSYQGVQYTWHTRINYNKGGKLKPGSDNIVTDNTLRQKLREMLNNMAKLHSSDLAEIINNLYEKYEPHSKNRKFDDTQMTEGKPDTAKMYMAIDYTRWLWRDDFFKGKPLAHFNERIKELHSKEERVERTVLRRSTELTVEETKESILSDSVWHHFSDLPTQQEYHESVIEALESIHHWFSNITPGEQPAVSDLPKEVSILIDKNNLTTDNLQLCFTQWRAASQESDLGYFVKRRLVINGEHKACYEKFFNNTVSDLIHGDEFTNFLRKFRDIETNQIHLSQLDKFVAYSGEQAFSENKPLSQTHVFAKLFDADYSISYLIALYFDLYANIGTDSERKKDGAPKLQIIQKLAQEYFDETSVSVLQPDLFEKYKQKLTEFNNHESYVGATELYHIVYTLVQITAYDGVKQKYEATACNQELGSELFSENGIDALILSLIKRFRNHKLIELHLNSIVIGKEDESSLACLIRHAPYKNQHTQDFIEKTPFSKNNTEIVRVINALGYEWSLKYRQKDTNSDALLHCLACEALATVEIAQIMYDRNLKDDKNIPRVYSKEDGAVIFEQDVVRLHKMKFIALIAKYWRGNFSDQSLKNPFRASMVCLAPVFKEELENTLFAYLCRCLNDMMAQVGQLDGNKRSVKNEMMTKRDKAWEITNPYNWAMLKETEEAIRNSKCLAEIYVENTQEVRSLEQAEFILHALYCNTLSDDDVNNTTKSTPGSAYIENTDNRTRVLNSAFQWYSSYIDRGKYSQSGLFKLDPQRMNRLKDMIDRNALWQDYYVFVAEKYQTQDPACDFAQLNKPKILDYVYRHVTFILENLQKYPCQDENVLKQLLEFAMIAVKKYAKASLTNRAWVLKDGYTEEGLKKIVVSLLCKDKGYNRIISDENEEDPSFADDELLFRENNGRATLFWKGENDQPVPRSLSPKESKLISAFFESSQKAADMKKLVSTLKISSLWEVSAENFFENTYNRRNEMQL